MRDAIYDYFIGILNSCPEMGAQGTRGLLAAMSTPQLERAMHYYAIIVENALPIIMPDDRDDFECRLLLARAVGRAVVLAV